MASEGKLSYTGRLELIQTLNSLPDSLFNKLVFALDPPPGLLPADAAVLGVRVYRLLDWADKTGPGLETVSEILGRITGQLKERRDSPIRELSDILGLTLAAMTTSQLWVALDHAEAFLVKYPDYPGVRKLKADIEKAIRSFYCVAPHSDPTFEQGGRKLKADIDKAILSFYRFAPYLDPTFEYETVFEYEIVTVDGQGKGRNCQKCQAIYRTETLGEGVSLEIVEIPVGGFIMGSPAGEGRDDERPPHLVIVESFWLGKYPVTQAQWREVAGFPKVERDLNPDPSINKGGNRPVEQVSWDDAIEFCQRLSKRAGREYRLPSEAEWEYACRAGTTTLFHYGETISTDLANYENHHIGTTEVGKFSANAFGLYDMHGNVWEWCSDHWHDNYDRGPTDGSGWAKGGESDPRVLRGGSWFSFPVNCRSAVRYRAERGYRDGRVGFRVACASSWTS